jgi:hypothetical protein
VRAGAVVAGPEDAVAIEIHRRPAVRRGRLTRGRRYERAGFGARVGRTVPGGSSGWRCGPRARSVMVGVCAVALLAA